jgi:gamma-tubulin complex component 2
LRDQGLVPRLNCLKRCFFLSHSSYLTHFLDLAHIELRKTAKAVSLVKLQSLLDLALGTDAHGDDVSFREDVRVTMATTGLYEWLLRIVNVSGVIGDDGDFTGDGVHDEHHKKGKDKDEKKPMLGPSPVSRIPQPSPALGTDTGSSHPQPSMLSSSISTSSSRSRS